jgi:hypothetical protein
MNQLYEAHGAISDPYSKIIEGFVVSQFPGAKLSGTEPLLDILTKVFVSSNNIRFGPAPNPESLVAIRAAIRANLEKELPIPILVPWGGRKAQLGYPIDIAELSALKQLHRLNQCVKEHYAPGIDINIRIEDTGALYLYQKDGGAGEMSTEVYSADFQKLVRILNLDFIHPIRESDLMSKINYFALSNKIMEPMLNYLMESQIAGFSRDNSASWVTLKELGWQGEIVAEQRAYYISRYKAADASLTDMEALQMLAQYFAGSLARYKLNGTARNQSWGNDFIQISFVPPVPGAPTSLVSKNLYYRTVPEKMSRSHMPAWRCKGYVLITDESACPKLTNFHDQIQLNEHWTTLSRAGESVDVLTSYRLEE